MTDDRMLIMCRDASEASTCSKVRFGAVAVDYAGNVLGRGCNNIPDPTINCATDCVGRIRLGVRSGTMVERCYAVHAEQQAIIKARKNGQPETVWVLGVLPNGDYFDNGGGFYCTVCARIMRAAGVLWVYVWSKDTWHRLTIEEAWDQSYSIACADKLGDTP